MKYKTSKKEMKENYNYILSVGYCEIDNLLRNQQPNSYCAGVYGWNCDNYELNGSKKTILLSTGYSPVATKNLKENYKLIEKYNIKAGRILNKKSNNYKKNLKELDKLVIKFVDEVLSESEAN